MADTARWSRLGAPSYAPGERVLDVQQAEDGTWWASATSGIYWYDGYRWQFAGLIRHGVLRRESGGALYVVSLDRRWRVAGGKLIPAGVAPACVMSELTHPSTFHWPRECVGKAGWWRGSEWVPLKDLPITTALPGEGLKLSARAVWWAGNRGLHRVSFGAVPGTLGQDRLVLPISDGGRGSLAVFALTENSRGDGLMVIGSPASHLGLWEWTGHGPPVHRPAEGTAQVTTALVDEAGGAIAVYQSGHIRVRGARGWVSAAAPEPLRQARHIRLGRNGEVIVVTERNIFRYAAGLAGWTRHEHPFPDGRNSVNAIVQAASGRRWLATSDGLEVLGPDCQHDWIRQVGGERLIAVTGLAEDQDGHIWVSSGLAFGGAWRFDGLGWKHFGAADGLTNQRIHRITRSANGVLWFASTGQIRGDTEEGAGAWRWDGRRFERWHRQRGLATNRVYAAAERDGEYWFVSQATISRRSTEGGWRHWRAGQELPADSSPFALVLPAGRQVFFADRRWGLGHLTEGGAVRHYGEADGLSSYAAWDLALDRQGRLWVTGTRGLNVWRDGVIAAIPEEAGAPRGQLWPVIADGRQVCVGSFGSGSACLDLSQAPAPPLVTVSEVMTAEEELAASWRVETAWGQPAPSHVPTRTRIDGGEWSAWSTERRRTWRHLRPGSHTIDVQAKGPLAEVTPVASRVMAVRGPVYRRPEVWIPIGLAAALVGAMMFLLVRRRREHAHEVARREAHFRALIERSADGVVVCSPSGEVTYASQGAMRLLSVDCSPGGPMWEAVAPADRPRVVAAFSDALRQSETPVDLLFRVDGPAGQTGWLQALITNRLQEPEVAGLVINLRNVTLETEALRQLEVARERAESASRAKSDFLATMSHEIRTPMNGILGMASLLSSAPLNEADRECAVTIRDSCRSLLILLNDILDLSRIEAGKVSIEREIFDLSATVAQVGELLSPLAAEKGLLLRTRYDAVPRWFWGDAGRTRQVLLNLAGNAVKFTERGVVEVTIVSQTNGVICRVRDTGIGIAPGKLEGIFEKFVQADATTTRRFGGSGLGLAITRSLVELMGGSVEVASQEGHGTVFTLSLPLEEAPAPAAATPAAPAGPLVRLPGTRVLVAEDNLVNQRVASRMLERLSCQAALAENGLLALQRAAGEHFDLILMDCQMPVLDGFAAAAELRRQGYRGPIVALTANNMAGDRERCLQAGMNDFLSKPMELEQLAAVLEKWCSSAVDQRP